ncbi:myozenin-2 [Danio aesculapii]|uniref:myozenin-2 n=1 Tax=Danio aesculapii TaxID=1142201 RepID=UPI0024BF15D8|nr:myozenin-2 [Danio aesculapii]
MVSVCEGLNLGKKISVPRDVMMEELNLNTNRGSIMFQERQRRVERFTLENAAENPIFIYQNHMEQHAEMQSQTEVQGGKENLLHPLAGKHSLAATLKNTVAKKGSPNALAPGYSGPLREIPREKFNATVIPKSYCSPWREALGENQDLLSSLNTTIAEPAQKLQPANYRSFNRAAMPFGGAVSSQRVIPVISFEALEPPNLSGMSSATMSKRRNFNRAPRGWGIGYSPESNDL